MKNIICFSLLVMAFLLNKGVHAQCRKVKEGVATMYDSTQSGYYHLFYLDSNNHKVVLFKGKLVRGTRKGLWKSYDPVKGNLKSKGRYVCNDSLVNANLKRYRKYVYYDSIYNKILQSYKDTTSNKIPEFIAPEHQIVDSLLTFYLDKRSENNPTAKSKGVWRYYKTSKEDGKRWIIVKIKYDKQGHQKWRMMFGRKISERPKRYIKWKEWLDKNKNVTRRIELNKLKW